MALTNTRCKIASLCPSSTNEAQFYAVPASTEIDGVLRITNIGSESASYRIAHTTAGHGDNAADADDWVVYNKIIVPTDTHEISIHANATETIRVKASVANIVVFHLSGNKKVTS